MPVQSPVLLAITWTSRARVAAEPGDLSGSACSLKEALLGRARERREADSTRESREMSRWGRLRDWMLGFFPALQAASMWSRLPRDGACSRAPFAPLVAFAARARCLLEYRDSLIDIF
ncbi:hypothetical protein [Ktedonospora formicarum]|uniref:hypothetical protein n=1 Tax=Ktedonospora formicarum TaxID=2778364 RepID=UPI001C688E4B|nr:hypothetical protein [Ktedonospora formicarum]